MAEAYIGAVYVKSPRDVADVSRYVDMYIEDKERAARLKSMVMATAY